MEAATGELPGMRNNIAAVIAALESAGIEFIEGGVRKRSVE
jgi:hypothetical protein